MYFIGLLITGCAIGLITSSVYGCLAIGIGLIIAGAARFFKTDLEKQHEDSFS